jgi:tetratricopeptide (TPR) repeat protein
LPIPRDAGIDEDRQKFDELTGRLNRLVAEAEWTARGQADLLRSLGDAHRYAGDYKLAIAAYQQSFDQVPNGIVQVYEAECLLREGLIDEALALIRTVDAAVLAQAEVADHAFVFFYIALASGAADALREADRLLRSAETPHAYFQTQRLQHMVAVQDALSALAANQEPVKVGGLLEALSTLSRYVQMQPNFSGVGFNFNNLIDDMVERAEKNARSKL